jgi:hypothetical protein
VTETRQDRDNYIEQNRPTSEEMVHHYAQLLKRSLEANDESYKKMLMNFEVDITFDGLGNLMQQEEEKYLYLYLDKVQMLSTEEQQRINILLYTR